MLGNFAGKQRRRGWYGRVSCLMAKQFFAQGTYKQLALLRALDARPFCFCQLLKPSFKFDLAFAE